MRKVFKWSNQDLKEMNVKIRKILTIIGTFNKKRNVKRKVGGGGFTSVVDCVREKVIGCNSSNPGTGCSSDFKT